MATYAIGDVQGCYEELRALLDALRFDPACDRIWFTGDLVNRGPRSLAVLRFVAGLGAAAVTVLGNHDLHLLAVAGQAGRGLRATDTLAEVLSAPDRDTLLDWLQRRPLAHHDAALGYTLVHAGLPPQWDIGQALACAAEVEAALARDARAVLAEMYGDQPDCWREDLTGPARLRFIVNCLTRLRFCTSDGRLLLRYKGSPSAAPAEAVPWFRVPGRRSRAARILCGHWSALGLHTADGVLALDTGCVWGGALTALRIDCAALPVQLPCPGSLLVGED